MRRHQIRCPGLGWCSQRRTLPRRIPYTATEGEFKVSVCNDLDLPQPIDRLALEVHKEEGTEEHTGVCTASVLSILKETKMKNLLNRLWNDEEGQDLTEYALLLVLLTLAAIGSLSTLATAVNGVFSKAAGNLTT